MSEAGQGAGQRSLYSTSGEQADSSSGNRKTGRPRKHQQAQLRLLCRTMAQVCGKSHALILLAG